MTASKEPNIILACVLFRIFLVPPLTIYVSFGRESDYEFEMSNLTRSEFGVLAVVRLTWATNWAIRSGLAS